LLEDEKVQLLKQNHVLREIEQRALDEVRRLTTLYISQEEKDDCHFEICLRALIGEDDPLWDEDDIDEGAVAELNEFLDPKLDENPPEFGIGALEHHHSELNPWPGIEPQSYLCHCLWHHLKIGWKGLLRVRRFDYTIKMERFTAYEDWLKV